MRHVVNLVVVLLVGLGVTAGCSARRSEPAVQKALYLGTDHLQLGQEVFMANCQGCHPGGEAGIGPPLNDRPLPGMAIMAQVRLGVGAMPSFPASRISDRELKALADYLVTLRRHH